MLLCVEVVETVVEEVIVLEMVVVELMELELVEVELVLMVDVVDSCRGKRPSTTAGSLTCYKKQLYNTNRRDRNMKNDNYQGITWNNFRTHTLGGVW